VIGDFSPVPATDEKRYIVSGVSICVNGINWARSVLSTRIFGPLKLIDCVNFNCILGAVIVVT